MTQIDAGTAYGMKAPSYKAELTEVRSGTPMGELMRRYWHPVGLAAYASTLPRQVRVLGEDLILFRDKKGRAGLVHPRCAHRGSSLLFGRVEEEGIRCCYHGWGFDVQGKCFDQPCEPEGGLHRDKIRQPWYPLEERYGLIWAYLGPADKKPLLPRYDVFETIPEGEQLFTDDNNIGSGRFHNDLVPYNWLQHYENIQDTAHFLWLHYFHSGAQFGSRYGELDQLDFKPWERLKDVQWRITPRGVASERTQTLPDGRVLRGVTETILPTVRGVANPFGKPGAIDTLGFVLPVDDHHIRIFTILRARDDSYFQNFRRRRAMQADKTAADPDYFQRYPGDWEAQGSQGPITLHSEEHLATSDRGIVMLRRLFQQQLNAIAEGRNPLGVAFEPGQELVQLEAGQYLSGRSDLSDLSDDTQTQPSLSA
jgi:nitrite reductase/ring-hydroxylating ferredoxin subunit